MSAIDILMKALTQTNAEVLRTFAVESPAALDAETKQLEAWLGGSGSGTLPSRDLMHEAIAEFLRNRRLASLKTARLVCFGCTEAFGTQQYRLIEDRERFETLLSNVDDFQPKPRAFRRCYRGLLAGYFSYDPDAGTAKPAGKDNWQALRSYLNGRVSVIRTLGMNPEWVDAIEEHRNLLGSEPCDRYGFAMLQGDNSAMQEFRSKLEISDVSWVIRKLVMAQVEAAIRLGDREFQASIPRLLELLGKHALYVGDGLAKVLTRYRASREVVLEPGLRDFAVSTWGNPWLELNAAKWGRVEQPVREMVGAWLKLDFIRQFFGLLANDGVNDLRRLKFWEQYVDSIDDMYFALGGHAATTRNADFQTLRKKMEGRRVELYRGGSPLNNAFIMMIGDYAIVEFGLKGNACFIFERSNLPFELSGRVSTDDIRHSANVGRQLHMDTGPGRSIPWENTFAEVLEPILRRRSRRGGFSTAARTPETNARAEPPDTPLTVNGVRIEKQYSAKALQQFAHSNRLRIIDHTNAGGALWVDAPDTNRVISEQLKAWGFRYSENKGRWWKGR